LERRKQALRESPKREASGVLRAAPGTVDPEGGKYGAGIIKGVSAVTRGEALGHGFWLDAEFLGQVETQLNSGDRKARFRHPGLSSDGLGTTLGTMVGAEVDGDKVVTDLHILESAHDTPEGDLAGYVMQFAEESPDLFGTSIVFRMDHAAARQFMAEHSETRKDRDGIERPDFNTFKSPDADNEQNLPHARLAALKAVDVVDEPAANPDGMFAALSDEGQMVEEFEAVLEYALGLTDLEPDADWLEFSPERLRGFVERFADARGMEYRFTKQRTMFTKTKEFAAFEARIADLEGQLNDQATELEAAREQITALTESNAEAKATAEKASKADKPAESLEDAVLGLSAEVSAMRDEVSNLDAKAEDKAVEKLAEMGHPPVEVPLEDEDDGPVPETELEIYEAMKPGEEKRAYLADNMAAIHEQAKAQR